MIAQRIKNAGAIDYTPTASVSAGDVIITGNFKGVAPVAIPANTLGAIETDGTFRIATASATTFAIGDPVYYNTTSKLATATTTDSIIGFAVAACASGDTTVDVCLVQGTGTAAAATE